MGASSNLSLRTALVCREAYCSDAVEKVTSRYLPLTVCLRMQTITKSLTSELFPPEGGARNFGAKTCPLAQPHAHAKITASLGFTVSQLLIKCLSSRAIPEMSRFFHGSDSSSESSEEEELYGSDEESEEEKKSGDDSSDDSSSGDEDDSDDSSSDDGSATGVNRFLRSDDEDESSEEEEDKVTVVRSAKDKKFEELEATVRLIENAEKIGDWAVISTGTHWVTNTAM